MMLFCKSISKVNFTVENAVEVTLGGKMWYNLWSVDTILALFRISCKPDNTAQIILAKMYVQII